MASKTVNGLFWSSMERISVQGAQFVLSLFIARILSPSDYGLVAMLGIFMAVAQTFVIVASRTLLSRNREEQM